MSNHSNNTGTTTKGSKQPKVVIKLKKLMAMFGEIEKDASDLMSFEDLHEQNKSLGAQLAKKAEELTNANSTSSELRDEISKLREEKTKLVGQYESETEALKKQQKEQVDLMTSAFAAEAGKWSRESETRTQYEKRIADLEKEVAEARSTNQDLERKLEKAAADCKQAQEALRKADTANTALKAKYGNTRESLESAQQSLGAAHDRLSSCKMEMGINDLDPADM